MPAYDFAQIEQLARVDFFPPRIGQTLATHSCGVWEVPFELRGFSRDRGSATFDRSSQNKKRLLNLDGW